MLKRHEDCGSVSRKRNLVLPKRNLCLTTLLALLLLISSWPGLLSAALPPILTKPGPHQEMIYQETLPSEIHLPGTPHPFQFQLKKQLAAGGHLNIIKVNTRLIQGSYDFDAWVQTDGLTVDGVLTGSNTLPDEDWAILEVVDANSQVLEKYLILTDFGDYLVVDLEH